MLFTISSYQIPIVLADSNNFIFLELMKQHLPHEKQQQQKKKKKRKVKSAAEILDISITTFSRRSQRAHDVKMTSY